MTISLLQGVAPTLSRTLPSSYKKYRGTYREARTFFMQLDRSRRAPGPVGKPGMSRFGPRLPAPMVRIHMPNSPLQLMQSLPSLLVTIRYMIGRGVNKINIVYPSRAAYQLMHSRVRKVLDRFFMKNRKLLRLHSVQVVFSYR